MLYCLMKFIVESLVARQTEDQSHCIVYKDSGFSLLHTKSFVFYIAADLLRHQGSRVRG
jgi:hypothetical protein